MKILKNYSIAVKALENFIITTDILVAKKQVDSKDRQIAAWSCPNPSGPSSIIKTKGY